MIDKPTSFTGQLTPIYWEILVPFYGVICVYTGWRQAQGLDAQVRLAWTQAAHWLAVLLAMYVIYLPQVQDVMNNNAAGITIHSGAGHCPCRHSRCGLADLRCRRYSGDSRSDNCLDPSIGIDHDGRLDRGDLRGLRGRFAMVWWTSHTE
jgi:hypothetical protein